MHPATSRTWETLRRMAASGQQFTNIDLAREARVVRTAAVKACAKAKLSGIIEIAIPVRYTQRQGPIPAVYRGVKS